MPMLGNGPVGVGVVLFLLATLFGYLTSLHSAFTAAGFTAALILVFGGQGEPWHMAWPRVLDTMLGAVVAFGVGALLWPVHARVGLRYKIASILSTEGARSTARSQPRPCRESTTSSRFANSTANCMTCGPRNHPTNGGGAERIVLLPLQPG
jgi:uncharacterized membrane protein YccC